jgi:hypothetical protein
VILDRYRDVTRRGTAAPGRRLRDAVEVSFRPRPDLILRLEPPSVDARDERPEPAALDPEPQARSAHGSSPRRPEIAWLDPGRDPHLVLREALARIWQSVLRRRRGEAIP